jgi:hypothetical protein
MAFNIDTFKTTISKKGLMSTAKFKVVITAPLSLQMAKSSVDRDGGINSWNSEDMNYADIARDLEFFCQSVDIPGINTFVSESRRYGYGATEKKPITVGFNECQMIFLVDGRGDNARFFHNWMKLMVNYDARQGYRTATGVNDQQYPFEVNYKQDYRTDIKVHLFNNHGDSRAVNTADGKSSYSEPVNSMLFTLREAYPIYIPHVPLNWEDKDGLMKLPVVFTYFDWYEKQLTSGA